jgi:hypothetical protein
MSNCKLKGMNLFEFRHKFEEAQPRNVYGNSRFNLKVCKCDFGRSNDISAQFSELSS